MKKILIGVVVLMLSMGASAQFHHGYYGRGYGYAYPRVGLSVGVGYPYYSYDPYYYPYGYPYYGYYYRPTQLDLKIEEINNKYDYKKSLVKHDKGLSHQQKKAEKKQLEYEREQAINQAKQDYYNNPGKK